MIEVSAAITQAPRKGDTTRKGVERAASDRLVRQTALEEGEARDKLYEEHPVTRNEVDVATPPLKEAYQVIQDVVVHRDPGTCLLGEFRVGKTTTINRTVQQLNETFPNLPVGIAIAKGHDKFTQGTFFSDLLEDFQHAGALRGTAAERRLRCVNMLIGQARQLSSDRYLLLVDEGQNWGEPQWTWLRDLANDLVNKKVRLITVTFAQPAEMRKARTLLLSRGRTDLVGRFLLNPREFRGLRDVHELTETLEAYDDHGHRAFPLGTDICYAEFFMPQAWKGGWRLADEAEPMWREFRRVAQRSGREAGNIGMNWIGGAIRNFLFSESMKDGPGYASTPEVWAMAVQASGYESTLF
jgi:hypothetical protein